MIKYELKILFSKRINRLLLLALLIIAIVFSCFAIWSINYVDENGTTHNGFTSPRKLVESRSEYTGQLTDVVFQDVISKDREIIAEYGSAIPDNVYATNGQAYDEIKELVVSILCYDQDYDESKIDSPDINGVPSIYNIRDNNIAQEIKKYGNTEKKSGFIKEQYDKVSIPFEYAPAESWKTMGLYATTYAIILLIAISFLSAGIFSEEFKLQTESVFFSTKYGRNRGTRAKIATGLIMATAIYWAAMLALSIISFTVMGVSGAHSPIQIEYSYSMYAYTFLQRYLVILLAGYVGSILASVVAMLVSAKSHSSLLAIAIPFVFFIVSPFIGRVLPFKDFFNITPDQLVNVYNCIRLPLVYQIGEIVTMQIPMLITVYSVVAILIIPFIYLVFNRYCAR